MVRDPYYDDEDTEYQLNESDDENIFDEDNEVEQHTSEEAVPEAVTPPGGSKMKKIIIWVVIVVLAVLIIYKVTTTLFKRSPEIKVTKTRPIATQPVVPTEQAKAEIPTVLQQFPKESAQPIVDQKMLKPEEVTSTLKKIAAPTVTSTMDQNKLLQAQQKNKELLSQVQQQLVENQSHLNNLNEQFGTLSSNILNLQGAISKLADQVKIRRVRSRAIAAYRARAYQRKQRAIRSAKRYFVEAVIPGRAWIRAADGSSMTVTVGDIVSGYGKVNSVNSFSGTVATSSGTSIHYGL